MVQCAFMANHTVIQDILIALASATAGAVFGALNAWSAQRVATRQKIMDYLLQRRVSIF